MISKDVNLSDGRYRKLEWYESGLFASLAFRWGGSGSRPNDAPRPDPRDNADNAPAWATQTNDHAPHSLMEAQIKSIIGTPLKGPPGPYVARPVASLSHRPFFTVKIFR